MKYFWSMILGFLLIIALTERADVAAAGIFIAGFLTYEIKKIDKEKEKK
nr:MAG TPA: hypothetical protein [Caudoviricetes sp.]